MKRRDRETNIVLLIVAALFVLMVVLGIGGLFTDRW
jgi:predicted nucleic acid-binding Zn ribbon protein